MGSDRAFGFGARTKARQRYDRGMFGAGVAGLSDALTFGGGDHVAAGLGAIGDSRGFSDWMANYRARLALEQAQDANDSVNHPIARTAGQVAGVGAQFALMGPVGGAAARALTLGKAAQAAEAALTAKRIAQTTRMARPEALGLMGGGAATGVGTQAASDIAAGRPSSFGDYASAGLGGAVDVGLMLRGMPPGRAGMVSGALSSTLGDVANGRPVSVDRAAQSASSGGYLGAAAGAGGRAHVQGLGNKAKEELGEFLSKGRTILRRDATRTTEKTGVSVAKGKETKPDQRTWAGDLVESKFGRWAKLTPNQRLAWQQKLPGYRVDHFLPRDVGNLLGGPAGLFGALVPRDDWR